MLIFSEDVEKLTIVISLKVTNELIKGIKPVSGCLLCVFKCKCRMYSVCIGLSYFLGWLGVMSGWLGDHVTRGCGRRVT